MNMIQRSGRWSHCAFGKNSIYNLFGQCGFFGQRLLGGFFALADQFTVELQPGALLVHTP